MTQVVEFVDSEASDGFFRHLGETRRLKEEVEEFENTVFLW